MVRSVADSSLSTLAAARPRLPPRLELAFRRSPANMPAPDKKVYRNHQFLHIFETIFCGFLKRKFRKFSGKKISFFFRLNTLNRKKISLERLTGLAAKVLKSGKNFLLLFYYFARAARKFFEIFYCFS